MYCLHKDILNYEPYIVARNYYDINSNQTVSCREEVHWYLMYQCYTLSAVMEDENNSDRDWPSTTVLYKWNAMNALWRTTFTTIAYTSSLKYLKKVLDPQEQIES